MPQGRVGHGGRGSGGHGYTGLSYGLPVGGRSSGHRGSASGSLAGMQQLLEVGIENVTPWRRGRLDRKLDDEPFRYGPRRPRAWKVDPYQGIIKVRLFQ